MFAFFLFQSMWFFLCWHESRSGRCRGRICFVWHSRSCFVWHSLACRSLGCPTIDTVDAAWPTAWPTSIKGNAQGATEADSASSEAHDEGGGAAATTAWPTSKGKGNAQGDCEGVSSIRCLSRE